MYKILLFIAIIAVCWLVYGVMAMLRKKAILYYCREDGQLQCFGDCVYKLGIDGYVFHDNTQWPANRQQGHSHIEKGLALIHLREDPSPTALDEELYKAGYVDLTGNVYSADGTCVGYTTDLKGRRSINGTGRWYELWLRKHSLVFRKPPLASEGGDGEAATDQLVGKVVETGRWGKAKGDRYTVTARAAGFLLLYQSVKRRPRSEDAMTTQTTWKDTALSAAVVYTLVYGIMYLLGLGELSIPALGAQVGFTIAQLGVYFLIWAILRQMKIESMLQGGRFDELLMLVNRNTGVGGLNNWIFLLGAIALFISIYIYGGDFLPLQAAILIGVGVNAHYVTKEPWEVSLTETEEELPVWTEEEDGDEGTTPLPTETERRSYRWTLDSQGSMLEGQLTLAFDPQQIACLRSENPFRISPEHGHNANAKELFDHCVDNRKVHELLRYIFLEARKASLTPMERMQFILDFVQMPNINYEYDERCDEIGNMVDYARYPDETLYDGRGDCDCKAVLAAVLFREAGYKTAYLTTAKHAAVAVAIDETADEMLLSMADEALLTHDGRMYYFCETTGDGFRIGDLGSTTKEAIQYIHYLN